MKTFATIVAAGLATSAVAQDALVTIAPAGGSSWTISAELLTAPSADGISSVWAEASFDLTSTDGSISNVALNQGYLTSPLGAPTVAGEGSGAVEIRGATMPGGTFFIGPDNDDSNPLLVGTFDYDGTAAGLAAALVGQNSVAFVNNANPGFGAAEFYQRADGSAGDRTLEFVIVPAPASAALLGLGGLAAARRRR